MKKNIPDFSCLVIITCLGRGVLSLSAFVLIHMDFDTKALSGIQEFMKSKPLLFHLKKKYSAKTRPLPQCVSPAEHQRGINTFSEIFTIFHFLLKSKKAAKSGEN